MVRAVLEGVSYSQKDCLEIIEGLGCPVASVRLSGGGARSAIWKQMFADVFDRTVVTLESQEGSAYGAALLAMVGTGAFGSIPEACAANVREVETVRPRPQEAGYYARAHKVFQSLYPALAPGFRAIGELG
jgi:xylulokinase